ncbi:hypothetical protein MC7420_7493 [Coleofasciculus chthonoplastes PCC 7420]|uniref:Response regulatory domain-containing protein n=1 Tax=Coleofasciculus chthonoplastes PCC 7420 TaxID=118168 RepID=B4VI16_9CYAN|nr:response regulator transcription factor [Coleofasciculus chthonoplastes]EDX78840.1 hypothetical protein MC7420_7493 [Coleofasciculus chthonoplastes PCC 7420]
MKILFIEDNDLNREAISEYLELHGYEVYAKPDGANFLEVVRECEVPQLASLKLGLPTP